MCLLRPPDLLSYRLHRPTAPMGLGLMDLDHMGLTVPTDRTMRPLRRPRLTVPTGHTDPAHGVRTSTGSITRRWTPTASCSP